MQNKMRRRLVRTLVAVAAVVSYSTSAVAAQMASSVPGITREHYENKQAPWSIHVLRIDRSRSNFELTTAMADGTKIGLSTLTDQVRRLSTNFGRPIAAINGDFYRTEGGRYAGDPRGLQIARGELISDPGQQTCFWIDTNGMPQMADVKAQFTVTWPNEVQTRFGLNEGRSRAPVLYTASVGASTDTEGGVEYVLEAADPRKWLPLRAGETYAAKVREIRKGGNSRTSRDTLILSMPRPSTNAVKEGEVVVLSTETLPSLRGVKTAIGGGPALLRGGKVQTERASKSGERHPRSAIGWNKKEIYFVQVDGRQSHSDGMTLAELAAFMAKIGCEEGMNLDGGASAEIWLNGEILNSPCWGRERPTGNALVLLDKRVEAKP